MKVLMVNWPRGAAVPWRGPDPNAPDRRGPPGVGASRVAESFDPEPDAAGLRPSRTSFNLRNRPRDPRPGDPPQEARHPRCPVAGLPQPVAGAVGRFKSSQASSAPPRTPGESGAAARRAQDVRPQGEVAGRRRHDRGRRRNRPRPDYDPACRQATLRQVDHLLPNSLLEMHHLMRTLRGLRRALYGRALRERTHWSSLDPDPGPFMLKHGPARLSCCRSAALRRRRTSC